MTNKAKYRIWTVALVALAYLVYRFYIYAISGVHDEAGLTGLVYLGIGLVVSVGIAGTASKYYEHKKNDVPVSHKELKAELDAYKARALDIQEQKNMSQKDQRR